MRAYPYITAMVVLFALLVANDKTESSNMPDSKIKVAIALMTDFAERTGLSSERPPQRYLWTDAFAVCNFLGLARVTRDEHYKKNLHYSYSTRYITGWVNIVLMIHEPVGSAA